MRLIGEDGQQIGILKTPDALRLAQERDLDLVEVAADARPPVCRILDYSKYRYEQAQKVKAAKKHQQQITIREIKFRPKIALNDYETKKGHVTRFLKHKDKVKITIMFRGREVTHPERGQVLLERLAEELADLAIVEQRPIQDGRNMTMMLGPSKAILAEAESGGARKPKGDAPKAEASAEAAAAARAEATPAAARAEAAPAEVETPVAAEADAPAAAEAPAVAEAEAPAPTPAEDAPAAAEAEAPAPAAEAPAVAEADAAPAEAEAPVETEAPARAAAPARRAARAAARADAPARRAPARRAAARAARRRAAARGDETPAEGAAATS
ncbi:translation initiation factor IF-3 [Conexibacter stalactiti]|uniref:translation initiation factor IF-3 n=1 Tax=Conexibacter stalactiti TaxID=1940611 RepID=UPI00384D7F41